MGRLTVGAKPRALKVERDRDNGHVRTERNGGKVSGDKDKRSLTALILVDVINHFEFPGGDQMRANTLRIAPCIRGLLQRAREAGIPVIYANDNFGRWLSDFNRILKRCMEPGSLGREIACQLAPVTEDYVILKPKHSAFFQTPLDLLLKDLGTEQIILTGISTNSCILFTANDAYMRDLKLFVPQDCVARKL